MPLSDMHLSLRQLKSLIDDDCAYDIRICNGGKSLYEDGNHMTDAKLREYHVTRIRCSSGECGKPRYQVFLLHDGDGYVPRADNVEVLIAKVREAEGLTVKELAARCAIAPCRISQMESGEIKPDLDTALRIAEAVGQPVESLFSLKGDQRSGKSNARDLRGQRFGMLTVECATSSNIMNFKNRSVIWRCRCECGRYRKVRSDRLRSGTVLSCGNPECEAKVAGLSADSA